MELLKIDGVCPHCGHVARYAEDLVGLSIPCAKCDTRFMLEEIEQAEEADAGRDAGGSDDPPKGWRPRRRARVPSAAEVRSTAITAIATTIVGGVITVGIVAGLSAIFFGFFGAYVVFAQYYSVRRIEEQLRRLRGDIQRLTDSED